MQQKGDSFTFPLKFALKEESLFTLEPNQPLANPGDKEVSFYIYVNKLTPKGDYVVYFTVLYDIFDNYTSIPICNI